MSQATERIHELVDKLNQYRNEYYNQDAPSVSDAVYDRLYDELELWEKDTGIILSNMVSAFLLNRSSDLHVCCQQPGEGAA